MRWLDDYHKNATNSDFYINTLFQRTVILDSLCSSSRANHVDFLGVKILLLVCVAFPIQSFIINLKGKKSKYVGECKLFFVHTLSLVTLHIFTLGAIMYS